MANIRLQTAMDTFKTAEDEYTRGNIGTSIRLTLAACAILGMSDATFNAIQ